MLVRLDNWESMVSPLFHQGITLAFQSPKKCHPLGRYAKARVRYIISYTAGVDLVLEVFVYK
jgi:hypothetical protein